MEPERLAHLDDALCEYVARMACMRPTWWMEAGPGLQTLVKFDPPERAAHSTSCRSCGGVLQGAERGRLLCAACRSQYRVMQGDPLIHTMYRSSHPLYVLDQTTETVVTHIKVMRKIASQDMALVKQLAYWSVHVHERWRAGHGNRNIYFTPEMDLSNETYAREITCCNPRYTEGASGSAVMHAPRHDAVTVGGLGPKLHAVVRQEAIKWLYNLDAMIRRRFAIPLEQEHGDMSIVTAIGRFAKLIADRVSRLEVRGDDETKYMSGIAFQHVIECENTRCKYHAAAQKNADICCMLTLKRLVDVSAVPETPDKRQRLALFLRKLCPELRKALPEVAQQYGFPALADALTSQVHDPAAIERWRATVSSGSLSWLIDRAMERAQEWHPADFLQCVRFDEVLRADHLPLLSWEDNAQMASWSLVSSTAHAHRRTGLDPAGLRIVLMSSALHSISADERFFPAGEMRHDLMADVIGNHDILATHAHGALTEQLRPYMVGAPWQAARTEMIEWKGSHIEDDVRRAGAVLGGFSVQEIAERYGWHDGSPAGRAARSRLHSSLVCLTTDKMVFKPAAQYEEWFPLALELVLPILAQLRHSVGISNFVATNPLGDVLQLMPRVRDWKPSDGVLQLSAGEVYKVPVVKTALNDLKAANSPLVRLRRPGRKGQYWIFDPAELASVLGR